MSDRTESEKERDENCQLHPLRNDGGNGAGHENISGMGSKYISLTPQTDISVRD
jgi:hypothetical protein